MKRKAVYVLAGTMVVVVAFSVWYLFVYLNPQTLREDFEIGLGEWVADAHVPSDPNKPGQLVEWSVTRVAGTASSGQYSIRLFIDGKQDDGTIWIERQLPVRRNMRVQVEVSFELHSQQQSFNTIAAVCAYGGVRNPEVEEDFTVLGPANQVAGWKRYSFATSVDTGSSDAILVAVGISVRWETYMTYHIDDVEVKVR